MKNNIVPVVAGVLILAVIAGIIARSKWYSFRSDSMESEETEPAALVTEEKSYGSTDIFTGDMQKTYQAAQTITVELVERTTMETDVSSETVYDRYLVSDVDLMEGKDTTADYHETLADSDNMEVQGEAISFQEAFGFSYKGMDAYEVYEKLLQENGLSFCFKDASIDDERSALTGYRTYAINDLDVITLMLSGETYDAITAQTVYVQVSKDGLPEYFLAEVAYRYGDWTITKSLYLQAAIEEGGCE